MKTASLKSFRIETKEEIALNISYVELVGWVKLEFHAGKLTESVQCSLPNSNT